MSEDDEMQASHQGGSRGIPTKPEGPGGPGSSPEVLCLETRDGSHYQHKVALTLMTHESQRGQSGYKLETPHRRFSTPLGP